MECDHADVERLVEDLKWYDVPSGHRLRRLRTTYNSYRGA
jgi:hypothetical protein